MLKEVLLRGEVSQGEVIETSGLKERTGRNLLRQLVGEGLLVSDTPKGEVRIGFPIHAAGWFLPDLYLGGQPLTSRVEALDDPRSSTAHLRSLPSKPGELTVIPVDEWAGEVRAIRA
jgi:hypothetical protein